MKGKVVYEPPRFMSVSEAAKQLLAIVEAKRVTNPELNSLLNEDTVCVALARVGSDDQKITCGSLTEMSSVDMGAPLHSLVIPGKLHPLETDMINMYKSSL